MNKDALKRFLFNEGEVISFEEDSIIFYESKKADYFYYLLDGRVRVSRLSIEGKETIVSLIHRDSFFAEIILTGYDYYPASAHTIERSRMIQLPKRIFPMIMDNSGLSSCFSLMLLNKLNCVTSKLHAYNCLDVEGRFFQFLLDTYGFCNSYDIRIPKNEIAVSIGTIPETFSRMIKKLKEKGIIEWQGKNLYINESFWEQFSIRHRGMINPGE